jgi:hypothetical protein
MKTVTFLGHQFPIETIKKHYAANARGLRRMVERSLKTGKYNGFTTNQLIEKAEQYESLSK